MTQADAEGFTPGSDIIVFRTGSASEGTVLFNPLTLNNAPRVTLSFGGNTVVFANDGAAVRGQSFTVFPDASRLFIGTAGNDTAHGTTGSDGLFGGDGNDTLDGGASGDDLLQGNQG